MLSQTLHITFSHLKSWTGHGTHLVTAAESSCVGISANIWPSPPPYRVPPTRPTISRCFPVLTTRYTEVRLDAYANRYSDAGHDKAGSAESGSPHGFALLLDTSALGSARYYDLSNFDTPLWGFHIPPHFQQLLKSAFSCLCGSLAAPCQIRRDFFLNISQSRDPFARLLSAGDPTSEFAS